MKIEGGEDTDKIGITGEIDNGDMTVDFGDQHHEGQKDSSSLPIENLQKAVSEVIDKPEGELTGGDDTQVLANSNAEIKRGDETCTYDGRTNEEQGKIPCSEAEAIREAILILQTGKEGRFDYIKKIAEGGQGSIFLFRDQALNREIAIKTFNEGKDLDEFIKNYQMMAKLEHVGIPPIYDVGISEGKRPYVIMRLLKGETLTKILSRNGKNRMEMLDVFKKICMAVHCAHLNQIAHLDLKPDNIIVNSGLGEVFVIDWDIGTKIGGEPEQEGVIKGTPSYMAPEQGLGKSSIINERTDIYALGVILYEMMTGMKPYKINGNITEMYKFFASLEQGNFKISLPSQKRLDLNIPPELDAIIMKAMAYNQDDRFNAVKEFHDAISLYMGGVQARERKRTEAMLVVREGQEKFADHTREKESLKTECRELIVILNKYREMMRKIKKSEKNKEEGEIQLKEVQKMIWEMEAGIERIYKRMILYFDQALQRFLGALEIEPENEIAKGHIQKIYWEKFLKAEEKGDEEGKLSASTMLLKYTNKEKKTEMRKKLRGWGEVSFKIEPEQAEIVLYQYEKKENSPEFQKKEIKRVNNTDEIKSFPLIKGMYALEATSSGYCSAIYPFQVDREECKEIEIRLIPEEEIPEGFIPIPAGPFTPFESSPEQKDNEFLAKIDAREKKFPLNIPDFAIGQYHVTIAQYLEFLNDLSAQGRLQEAKDNLPFNIPAQKGYINLIKPSPSLKDKLPRLFKQKTEKKGAYFELLSEPDSDGDIYDPDWPVFDVSYDNAMAYCAWLTEKKGQGKYRFRLPTKEEWEKAATGGLGWRYPWGNEWDDFACLTNESIETGHPAKAGSMLKDRSPYGVCDMAGNVGEWTSTKVTAGEGKAKDTYELKGGNYIQGSDKCDVSKKTGEPSCRQAFASLGFRVVRERI